LFAEFFRESFAQKQTAAHDEKQLAEDLAKDLAADLVAGSLLHLSSLSLHF